MATGSIFFFEMALNRHHDIFNCQFYPIRRVGGIKEVHCIKRVHKVKMLQYAQRERIHMLIFNAFKIRKIWMNYKIFKAEMTK